MSTWCNRFDLQTLGSQPIRPKNLPDQRPNRIWRALKTSILNTAHDPGHRKSSDDPSQRPRWQRWPRKFTIVRAVIRNHPPSSSCINAISQELDASSKLNHCKWAPAAARGSQVDFPHLLPAQLRERKLLSTYWLCLLRVRCEAGWFLCWNPSFIVDKCSWERGSKFGVRNIFSAAN